MAYTIHYLSSEFEMTFETVLEKVGASIGSGKPEIGVGRKRVVESWSSGLKICLCKTQAHRKNPASCCI